MLQRLRVQFWGNAVKRFELGKHYQSEAWMPILRKEL
jgi:hypothetical protein